MAASLGRAVPAAKWVDEAAAADHLAAVESLI
jgi:hypothetical protein